MNETVKTLAGCGGNVDQLPLVRVNVVLKGGQIGVGGRISVLFATIIWGLDARFSLYL